MKKKLFQLYDFHILASSEGIHYGIPVHGGLENMQDTIEDFAQAFENHPAEHIQDYLLSLSSSDIKRHSRILRIVSNALKTAELRESE